MSLCKICRKNKATVPDRNHGNIGRLRFEVCGQCHADRLRNDLIDIMIVERRRRERGKEAGIVARVEEMLRDMREIGVAE